MSQNNEFSGISSSLSSYNPLAIIKPINLNNFVCSTLNFSSTVKGNNDKSVVLYQRSVFSFISLAKSE